MSPASRVLIAGLPSLNLSGRRSLRISEPVKRAYDAGGRCPQKFSAVFASRCRSLASVFAFAVPGRRDRLFSRLRVSLRSLATPCQAIQPSSRLAPLACYAVPGYSLIINHFTCHPEPQNNPLHPEAPPGSGTRPHDQRQYCSAAAPPAYPSPAPWDRNSPNSHKTAAHPP